MVRLYTKAYNSEEFERFHEAINTAIEFMRSTCPNPNTPCYECKYKHICTDLEALDDFLLNQIE